MLGFDLRGHGKSAGPRGHIPSYETLLDDITAFLGQVEARYPGVPQFLYGHSLGGNLVLNYPLRCQSTLHGVIATGPWLELAFKPPAGKVSLARMMNQINPGYSQPSGLKAKDLSHDPAVVTAYERDPLVHGIISARMFFGLYESGLWALAHAAEFPLPALIMNGAEDQIVSAKACRVFAERAGEKVTLKIWEGMFHEVHNEAIQDQVYQMMVDWMDKH
jgi:alpha-beta hydrolase superfamily lysophospholipase